MLAWYVLSLYPGEQALKTARGESIKQGLSEFKDVQSLIESHSAIDGDRLKSIWNSEKTLNTRKSEVLGQAGSIREMLEIARTGAIIQLEKTEAMLLERDRPTQLIVELIDGSVAHIRQRELVAA